MQCVYALGELGEGLDGVVALDLAAGGDVEGLARVLAVADVRAEDADALDDREEDVRAQVRLRGEADDHERAAHAQVVDRLRVRGAGGRGDDGGVRAEAVGGGDDVLDEVLGLAEVDPLLGAEARDELLLFSAGVCVCGCKSGGRLDATHITSGKTAYRWRRRGGPWRRRTGRPSDQDLHRHRGGRSSHRSWRAST